MEKKRTHTIEEIDELKNWFKENSNKLPQTMQIDSSAFTPDLPRLQTLKQNTHMHASGFFLSLLWSMYTPS